MRNPLPKRLFFHAEGFDATKSFPKNIQNMACQKLLQPPCKNISLALYLDILLDTLAVTSTLPAHFKNELWTWNPHATFRSRSLLFTLSKTQNVFKKKEMQKAKMHQIMLRTPEVPIGRYSKGEMDDREQPLDGIDVP